MNPDTHQALAARALTADYRIALSGRRGESRGRHVVDHGFSQSGLMGRPAPCSGNGFSVDPVGDRFGARVSVGRRVTTPFILRAAENG
jgi:hypothetical protein